MLLPQHKQPDMLQIFSQLSLRKRALGYRALLCWSMSLAASSIFGFTKGALLPTHILGVCIIQLCVINLAPWQIAWLIWWQINLYASFMLMDLPFCLRHFLCQLARQVFMLIQDIWSAMIIRKNKAYTAAISYYIVTKPWQHYVNK